MFSGQNKEYEIKKDHKYKEKPTQPNTDTKQYAFYDLFMRYCSVIFNINQRHWIYLIIC